MASTNMQRCTTLSVPPLECSFAWRKHADFEQLTQMSRAWLEERFAELEALMGRSSMSVERLHAVAFHSLIALMYPEAISKRMMPLVKVVVWAFLVDDLLDDPTAFGASPDSAEELVDALVAVFNDATGSSPSSPLVRLVQASTEEWWAEVTASTTPFQKARLRASLIEYLTASQVEIGYRSTHQVVQDLDTYFRIRAGSIGWKPWAVLVEYSHAIELDEETLSHPLLLALHHHVNHQFAVTNDLISLQKEYEQGDFCNIVLVLYIHKLSQGDTKVIDALDIQTSDHLARGKLASPALLQECVQEAWQMNKDLDHECARLMDLIRQCDVLMQKSGMEKYLKGLAFCISGSLEWYRTSKRYSIVQSNLIS